MLIGALLHLFGCWRHSRWGMFTLVSHNIYTCSLARLNYIFNGRFNTIVSMLTHITQAMLLSCRSIQCVAVSNAQVLTRYIYMYKSRVDLWRVCQMIVVKDKIDLSYYLAQWWISVLFNGFYLKFSYRILLFSSIIYYSLSMCHLNVNK